jgi:peptidoglycan/LPS O-acetylase OafA/YrhL
MRTIQDQLDFVQNRPSGFDYLRLFLSIAVIAWHGIIVCYGRPAESPFWTGPLRPLVCFILPSFFALSGFLVAGSLERNTIPAFLTLRALRIFPALAVEVLISALIIGPLLTTVTWPEYFSSEKFFHYFFNIVGRIHYELPGVFGNVPLPNLVNLQLWTVPYELICYIAITILALLSIARRPIWLFSIIVGGVLLGTARHYTYVPLVLDDGPPGDMLVIAFLFGASLYVMRRYIPYSAPLLLISVLASWVLLINVNGSDLAALPVTYITIFLGLQNPPKTLLIRGADYSYGIYLYGFPLQQSVSNLFPAYRIWYVNVLGSFAAAGVCAYLSWTFLESKVLNKRKLILSLVSSRCAWFSSLLRKAISPDGFVRASRLADDRAVRGRPNGNGLLSEPVEEQAPGP